MAVLLCDKMKYRMNRSLSLPGRQGKEHERNWKGEGLMNALRDNVLRHLQASCHTLDAPSTLEAMTCVLVIPPRVHQDGAKDSQIIFTDMPRPAS